MPKINGLYNRLYLPITIFFTFQIFQSEILNHVDKKLELMVEDVLNEVKRFDLQNNELKQLFNDQNGNLANSRRYVEYTRMLMPSITN